MNASTGSEEPTGPTTAAHAAVGLPKASPSWPYVLLGLALVSAGIAAWRPIPAGVWHDDGVYVLVGKAIAGGHGFTYDGVVGSPPAAKFPPGYPVLLAALWTMFGSIGAVTLAATFLNLSFLAVAGALFAKALRTTTGLSLKMSLAAAALGFVSTDLLRTALVPLSESLFMVLAMGSLALWPGVARSPASAPPGSEGRPPPTAEGTSGSTGAAALLTALLFAAVMTRSAALALVIAFAMALFARRGPLVAFAVTAPSFLASWWWGRWSAEASAQIPEGARDLLGPYGSWLADQTLAAPGAFLSGLPGHAVGVASRAAAIILPGLSGTPLLVAAAILFVPAALGVWRLIERFPPLGWFTLGYLAMLLLWPYLDRRLLAPWHPALVASIAVGGTEMFSRTRSTRVRNVVVGAAAIWAVAFSSATAFRIADGWPTAPYRLRAERLATAVEALTTTAPPTAIIGAPEFWAALHLHGGWTVAPSVRFDPRSVDPEAPMWGTADEQIALWRAAGIDHLLLEQAGLLHSAALDQIEADCPGAVVVLARMESAMIVRLDGDEGCGGGGG